jgi:DUF3037 family protein
VTAKGLEYFVLDYVPNPIRGERVCIAAVVFDSMDLVEGACVMALAGGWQERVRLFDPDADVEMLDASLREIKARLLSKVERSEMIRQMEESFSNVVQVSKRKGCLVADKRDAVEAFARSLLS